MTFKKKPKIRHAHCLSYEEPPRTASGCTRIAESRRTAWYVPASQHFPFSLRLEFPQAKNFILYLHIMRTVSLFFMEGATLGGINRNEYSNDCEGNCAIDAHAVLSRSGTGTPYLDAPRA